MEVTVRISLLSYIPAEIYDIAYVLPVNVCMFDLPFTATSESIHNIVQYVHLTCIQYSNLFPAALSMFSGSSVPRPATRLDFVEMCEY